MTQKGASPSRAPDLLARFWLTRCIDRRELGVELAGDDESDLGRLLGHLRDFSQLAAMVSLQAPPGGASPGLSLTSRSAPAVELLELHIGDRVTLKPEPPASGVAGLAASMQGLMGLALGGEGRQQSPLRGDEVGQVSFVGDTHARVVPEKGGSPWWYPRQSLNVLAVGAGGAAVGLGGLLADAAGECEALTEKGGDWEGVVSKAASQLLARVLEPSKKDLRRLCAEQSLVERLGQALSHYAQSGHAGSGALLSALLSLAEVLARALFRLPSESGLVAGQAVRVRDEETVHEGVLLDHLGFGRVAVQVGRGRQVKELPLRDVTPQRTEESSGIGTGVVNYLSDMLHSRAVPNSDVSMAQRVLADGANIEHRDSATGHTPLLAAAKLAQSRDLIALLLERGADVHATSLTGATALRLTAEHASSSGAAGAAADARRVEVVKLLLRAGASKAEVDLTKSSEAIRAVIEAHTEEARDADEASCTRVCSAALESSWQTEGESRARAAFVACVAPQLLLCVGRAGAPLPMHEGLLRRVALVFAVALEPTTGAAADSATGGDVDLDRESAQHSLWDEGAVLESAWRQVQGPELRDAVLRVTEELVASSQAREVLAGLRLLQALLARDTAAGETAARYCLGRLVGALPGVSLEAGGELRVLHPSPGLLGPLQVGAPGRLSLSLGGLLGAVGLVRSGGGQRGGGPQLDATPQGVTILGQRVAAQLRDAGPARFSVGEGARTRARQAREKIEAPGGAEDALAALMALLCDERGEGITSSELEASGLVPALLGFLSDPRPAEHRRRSRLLRRALMGMPRTLAVGSADGEELDEAEVPEENGSKEAQDMGEARPHAEGRAMAALIRHLLCIVASNEVLPVVLSAEAAAGETGLGQVLEPHRLNLSLAAGGQGEVNPKPGERPGDTTRAAEAVSGGDGAEVAEEPEEGRLTVLVEPLLPVADLERHVLRTTAVSDPAYLAFCEALVGWDVWERAPVLGASEDEAEPTGPYRRARVERFSRLGPLGLGVHTLRYLEPAGARPDTLRSPSAAAAGARRDVVLAARDYLICPGGAAAIDPLDPPSCDARGTREDDGEEEEEERNVSVVITYPHDAVPVELFLECVMGAIQMAMRQPDPGQTPFGRSEGDDYDLPSRGFPEGLPEFQQVLTRGLSEAPFTAPVARGQTRREAQVLLSRLNGICEASLQVDPSRSFMRKLNVGPIHPPGSRVESTQPVRGQPAAVGTVLGVLARGGGAPPRGQSDGSERYLVVWDDGEVVQAVPRAVLRPLALRRDSAQGASGATGRQMLLALGRVQAVFPAVAEETSSHPAALWRVFPSFVRNGAETNPGRLDMTVAPEADASGASPASACPPSPARLRALAAPPPGGLRGPEVRVTFAIGSLSATEWHNVALSSQARSLYALSRSGTSARKAERDSYVDTLRTTTGLHNGAHTFRVRVDATAGEDFCNHLGLIAGTSYRGSALNSNGTCSLEIDSGRVCIDGRWSGSTLARNPSGGDVVSIRVDLEQSEVTFAIESDSAVPPLSVAWTAGKRPVFLACSFRRVGWQVTLLGKEDKERDSPEGEDAGPPVAALQRLDPQHAALPGHVRAAPRFRCARRQSSCSCRVFAQRAPRCEWMPPAMARAPSRTRSTSASRSKVRSTCSRTRALRCRTLRPPSRGAEQRVWVRRGKPWGAGRRRRMGWCRLGWARAR